MSHVEPVTIDEKLTLPANVAAAFNRHLRVLSTSDAFVDRVFSVHQLVDCINAWRWAGFISSDQCNFLYRKVRSEFVREAGVIGEPHNSTALELDEHERAREEEQACYEARSQAGA